MGLFRVESIKRVWNIWNIRGLIILSLLVQTFLVLLAPWRKSKGGKLVVLIPIWSAYLLADWVATFTIGLMLRAEHSEDIVAFWAPFLLLHLGGPDLITSFSLEDNEFWIRHLLGLILQVGSTIYVILQSLPQNNLFLPAFLVLIAGTIKYAERNRSFYLACMDNFGDNWWKHQSGNVFYGHFPDAILKRMTRYRKKYSDGTMAGFGILKSLLVGPPVPSEQKHFILSTIRDSNQVLHNIESSLSLLYDLLHTKFFVTFSQIGSILRFVPFGCILGALALFSKRKKHYQLDEFDVWLTNGLLIGALALDYISFFLIREFFRIVGQDFAQRRSLLKWSSSVPQLNFITYHGKDCPAWFNRFVDYVGIKSLFDVIRRVPCACHKNFSADQEWQFIFSQLRGSVPIADNELGKGKETHERYGGILQGNCNLNWSIKEFEYMESLVMWHIATEVCYRSGCPNDCPSSPSISTSTSSNIDPREICKLLSDYMFYLLVAEPSMIPTPSPDKLKDVFRGAYHGSNIRTWKWPDEKRFREPFVLNLEKLLDEEKEDVEKLSKKIKKEMDTQSLSPEEKEKGDNFSRVTAACYLAKELLSQSNGCPWELMSRVWVEFVCYAAINCKPVVHARQVSRGGQLLTLVWLLMNLLGLTRSKEWHKVEGIEFDLE